MSEINLDIKDKKILMALDMDARAAESTIAKRVGLSKQMVNYRIRRMEKKGVILSYYPVIDHNKLGLKLFRIALKFENLTKEKETEMISFLKGRSSWMVSVLGNWDIWMALYAKDENEFMAFWNEFHDRYSYYINSRWVSIMVKFWNYEKSFIIPKKDPARKEILIGLSSQNTAIDDKDKAILKEMSSDARKTSLDISKKLKLTERVVRLRIKKLENQKIILGYRTFINTSILGMKYYKLFVQLKNAKKQDIAKIRSYITTDPNVVYSTEALGGYDFELEANFKDSFSLFEFTEKLRERFPEMIKEISHMEYIKEHKVSYYPFI